MAKIWVNVDWYKYTNPYGKMEIVCKSCTFVSITANRFSQWPEYRNEKSHVQTTWLWLMCTRRESNP